MVSFEPATGMPDLHDPELVEALIRNRWIYLGFLVRRVGNQADAEDDRKATLFYLDPPYWGCETDYGHDLFSRDDFEHMATVLKALKGHFILSLNDVSEVREIFAGFTIEPVKLTYTVGGGKGQSAKEVIIANFEVKQENSVASN